MRLQFIAVTESERQLKLGRCTGIEMEKTNSVCMPAPCPSAVQMTPIEIRFIQVEFEKHTFN